MKNSHSSSPNFTSRPRSACGPKPQRAVRPQAPFSPAGQDPFPLPKGFPFCVSPRRKLPPGPGGRPPPGERGPPPPDPFGERAGKMANFYRVRHKIFLKKSGKTFAILSYFDYNKSNSEKFIAFPNFFSRRTDDLPKEDRGLKKRRASGKRKKRKETPM